MIGQFGLAIHLVRIVVPLSGEVVELDPAFRCPHVAAAGQDDDATLRRRLHLRQQPVAHDEVAQVIGDELLLKAVHLLKLRQRHDARVEDQHVDRDPERLDAIGASDDGRKVREFDDHRRGAALDPRAGLLGLFQRARGADDVGTAGGKYPHRFVTQARVAPGDERCLAAEIDALDDLLRRGFCAKGSKRHAVGTNQWLVVAAAAAREARCHGGAGKYGATNEDLAAVEWAIDALHVGAHPGNCAIPDSDSFWPTLFRATIVPSDRRTLTISPEKKFPITANCPSGEELTAAQPMPSSG